MSPPEGRLPWARFRAAIAATRLLGLAAQLASAPAEAQRRRGRRPTRDTQAQEQPPPADPPRPAWSTLPARDSDVM